MEVNSSENVIALLPPILDNSTAGNWSTNVTQFAGEVSNYSLNFMDVGVVVPPPIFGEPVYYIPVEEVYRNNSIRLTHAPVLTKAKFIQASVLLVIGFFSLVGNLLTMWNIYKTRLSRRNSRHSSSAIYSLIFHLSIADILVTGFCIIGEGVWRLTVQWLAGEFSCRLVKLLQMFSLYLSTYVLVLIGLDRWIAVKYPMKSLNMAKRCHRLLAVTYALSLMMGLPQFFIFHVDVGPFFEEFHQCVTHGFYTAKWQEQLYGIFSLVTIFLMPLCILFATYLSTFRTISSSEKIFQSSKLAVYSNNKTCSYANRQRLIHKAKMKSLRISVVIIFAFVICWTPYYVKMIFYMFAGPHHRLNDELSEAIFFFGSSNSLVNPLIYGAFHLCPSKDKAARSSSNNGTYALNRGDSQRTVFSAVTQFDGRNRHMRSCRQPNYFCSHSGNSCHDHEHVNLLPVTPTPTAKGFHSASMHTSRPHHCTPLRHASVGGLLQNGKGPHSAVILNYNNQKGGVAALCPNSSTSLSGMNKLSRGITIDNMKNVAPVHSHNAANESVSSV